MIAIVDYEAGNLTSVRLAFAALEVEAVVTDDAAVVRKADHVVFPGVGAAGAAMSNLRRLGLEQAIRDVAAAGVPFLGICLGAQIILSRSEEDGGVDTLGLIPGEVRLFRPADRKVKVPQIGWNSVLLRRGHPLFEGIKAGSEFYFIHSYYPAPANLSDVRGTTDYGETTFASMLGSGNIMAMQFHPEKSGRIGLRILRNFSEWDGRC